MGKKRLSFLPLPFPSHAQPDLKAETNNMPAAGWLFIPAYYQHFWPKLPVYSTYNWAIAIQLGLEEAYQSSQVFSEIFFNNASLLATCSSRSWSHVAPGRTGCSHPSSSVSCHSTSVGMLCCTRKWWASGRLCSTAAEGEAKEPFWDEGALGADVLHCY